MSETAGKTIKCRAAVAWEAAKPLTFEEIEVEPPRAKEVRIRILSTAVCHTDAYTLSGIDPEGLFPVILGHEGAGVVESVGEGVTSVKPGDHVIPLYIPQCGSCKFCKSPKTNLCSTIRTTQGRGVMPDGTTRFHCRGKPLYHFMGTSTFSEYTVCAEMSVAKISDSAKMSRACLLGCGVATGYGAPINNSPVEPGSQVAVWGLGAVGLAAIGACKERGAKRIFAVDTNPAKYALAREFGATDCVNPLALEPAPGATAGQKPETLVEWLVRVTDGGLDYSFECVGNVRCMRDALEATHKGWGVSTIIGVAGAGQEIATRPFQLVTGRTWKGSAFGGWKSRENVPTLVDRAERGDLPFKLDQFVTHELPFDQLNHAFELLHAGSSIRTVLNIA